MRAWMAAAVTAAVLGGSACDSQPGEAARYAEALTPIAPASAGPVVVEPPAPSLSPEQGVGGAGMEGLGTEATGDGASAQAIIWTRTQLGDFGTLGR